MDHFHSYRVINIRILLTRNKLNSRNHPLPDYRRVGKDLAVIVFCEERSSVPAFRQAFLHLYWCLLSCAQGGREE